MTAPRDVPTGIVTFLFTDIEGSTKLLSRDPRAADCALARHHELLRSAVEAHSGWVFETVGDAVYAAFGAPAEAIAAAIAAQRGVATEDWGAAGELRIRAAVHSGSVELRGRHYFGRPLFAAARIMALAHGGQTLVSEATAALVRDDLPSDAGLRGLGRHRLKDLDSRLDVFQLEATGLATAFPALRSLGTSNLPETMTSFVGRADLMASIVDLLSNNRLVTLVGPGGIGKTRLAIEVGSAVADRFPHGVWWIPLGDIRDPAAILPAIAGVVGARGDLSPYLADWDALLVIDNLEQVIDGAADLAHLIGACPRIRVIATSREALRVNVERVVQVQPLSQDEGLELVRRRIGEARPDAIVDEATGTSIWRILDGLPLAIELAAARARAMDPSDLLERLEHRLGVLVDGPRDAPDRQRTLRGAIAWSYDLLDSEDRQAFERLGVFDGGWTIEAAAAICDVDLDAISHLVDRSLVSSDARRFAMLPTIREFADERFDERLDREFLRRAHAEWFGAFADTAEQAMWNNLSEGQWLDRLMSESANLRTAMLWAIDRGAAELALVFLSSCWRYWLMRGRADEGRVLGEAALRLPYDGPPALRMKAGLVLGEIARFQGDMDRSAELKIPAIALARQLGAEELLAASLHDMAWIEIARGQIPGARVFADEALAIRRRLGDPSGIGHALNAVGAVARAEGDYVRAVRAFEQSRSLLEPTTSHWAAASIDLGMTLVRAGRLGEAAMTTKQGLEAARAIDDRMNLVDGLSVVAEVAARRDPAVGARFLGASRRQATINGLSLGTSWWLLETTETLVRQSLDDAAFESAITSGANLDREDAIEEAIAWLSTVSD